MHRTMLAIAAVVLVVTGTVVGFVVYRHLGQRSTNVETLPVVEPNTPDVPVAETPELSPRPKRTTPAGDTEAPVDPSQNEVAEPLDAVEPEPVVEASDDVKKRISDLLSTLSQDEKNEMVRQISQERRDRYREEYRYRLRTQAVVDNLKWHRDELLRLTDLQNQQLSSVIDPMRPRMQESLAGLWAREDELRREIGQMFREGRRDEIGPLNDELRDLMKQTEEVKNQYNAELNLQLQDILTPEQLDWLKKRDTVGRSPQRIDIRR